MPHFLDKLVAQKFEGDLYFREFIDLLPQAEMFKAENVFEYFHSAKKFRPRGAEGRYEVQLTDFPSVAPPFPVFFVSGGPDKGQQYSVHPERGCLFIARPIMDNQHAAFSHILQHGNIGSSRLALQQAGVEWVLYVVPFIQLLDDLWPPLTCSVILVDKYGKIYVGPDSDPGTFMNVIDENGISKMTKWLSDETEREAVLDEFPVYSPHDYQYFFHDLNKKDLRTATFFCKFGSVVEWPSLLTLCFLHCRNVEVVEHDPLVSRQLRKQSERRKEKIGYGLIKFRTLEIELVKRILKDEGESENKGLGVALHTCRGHFKDYRDGKGIFGKGKGLYWWDNHVRGSAEHGTVLKDYKIPEITIE